VFDGPLYDRLNRSRGEVVASLVGELRNELELKTAIDIGCGLGYFASALQSLGFQVSAIDGRHENVAEAQRRYPKIQFRQFDAQDTNLRKLGKFDLVLCFGLLYHLENPFLTIRNVRQMTGRLLLVEAIIFPGDEPVMALVDESRFADQGLNHVAFYPTEACLVKMLYKAGFSFVYGLRRGPNHPEYYAAENARRTRTMLVASLDALKSESLRLIAETSTAILPWDRSSGVERSHRG